MVVFMQPLEYVYFIDTYPVDVSFGYNSTCNSILDTNSLRQSAVSRKPSSLNSKAPAAALTKINF